MKFKKYCIVSLEDEFYAHNLSNCWGHKYGRSISWFFKIYFWTSFWHSALLCGSAGAATEAAILHAVVLSVRESTQWGNCWLSSSLFLSNSSNVVMRRFGDSSRHERKRNVAFPKFFRLGQDGTTLLVWPNISSNLS